MNAPTTHLSIIDTYAASRHMERQALEAVMFRSIMPDKATKEDLIGFLQIAYRFDLDPWAREIFCIVNRGKIQPYISIDGYAKIVNRQPQYDGCSFEDHTDDEGVYAITCSMHRKDRSRPTSVTEYLDECRKPTEAWKQSPKRMLRHRAFIQAARLAFGISAALDEAGEGGVIIDAQTITVPPEVLAAPPTRKAPPSPKKREPVFEKVVEQRRQDDPELYGGAKEEPVHDPETGEVFDPEAFLTELDEALHIARTPEELTTIYGDHDVQLTLHAHPQHMDRAAGFLMWHAERLKKKSDSPFRP